MQSGIKWYYIVAALLMISVGVIFVTKKDSIPDAKAADVTFKFESWLPGLLQAGAVTLCQTVHFKEKQSELTPWTNEGYRQYIKHELNHVAQCERIGRLDFFFGYWGNSFGRGVRLWSLKKAYIENSYEVEAVRKAYEPFTEKELEIVRRYFPQ